MRKKKPDKQKKDEEFKTMIFMPLVMSRNFELCCLIMKISRSEGYRIAVADFIRKHGLDPEVEAKISLTQDKEA